MSKNPLDLNQLTMDDIDFSGVREALEQDKQIEKEYQEKYGDDWWEHYVADTNVFRKTDFDEEVINDAIFGGYRPCVTGHPKVIRDIQNKYVEKMKRLFGWSWKRHICHKPNDSKVNNLLLKDALKSGKWKELPKELHEEYHRLAGE